jgi:hypothetical protein
LDAHQLEAFKLLFQVGALSGAGVRAIHLKAVLIEQRFVCCRLHVVVGIGRFDVLVTNLGELGQGAFIFFAEQIANGEKFQADLVLPGGRDLSSRSGQASGKDERASGKPHLFNKGATI